MSDDSSLIHSPSEGESLDQYLQRFTDEEIRQINSNRVLLRRFSSLLQESFRDFESTEDGLENLWTIIQRVNDFDRLQYFIERLEPIRLRLLESLLRNAEEIERISVYCNAGRLVGSALDITGTVTGLWMRDSSPGYANLAFRTATAFGLLGLVSTLSEMNIMKNTLEDLMQLIKEDQDLFAPIQRWYQQTDELEVAMQAIFPFDVTHDLVADFADLRNSEITPVNLLSTLIRSIGEQDISLIRDASLIQNLINFTLYPASRDWLEWIIIRRHPIILDITRIILQLQRSPLRFVLCQSIPALAVGDQNIQSFSVWGRIGLNLASMIDTIRALRSSEIPSIASEIRHLHRHFRSEMAALQRIAEFVLMRRNQS